PPLEPEAIPAIEAEPIPVVPISPVLPIPESGMEEPLAVLPVEDDEVMEVSLPEIDPDAEGFFANIASIEPVGPSEPIKPVRPPAPPADPAPGVGSLCEGLLSGDPPLLPDLPEATCRGCQEQIPRQDQFIEGYYIVRPVGKGSMGVVYLAVRKKDGVPVALKMIIPAVTGTTAQLKRFLREAEILQKLQHPNIVSFRESGESGGKIFFAMDY